jgi:hypothetical protein
VRDDRLLRRQRALAQCSGGPASTLRGLLQSRRRPCHVCCALPRRMPARRSGGGGGLFTRLRARRAPRHRSADRRPSASTDRSEGGRGAAPTSTPTPRAAAAAAPRTPAAAAAAAVGDDSLGGGVGPRGVCERLDGLPARAERRPSGPAAAKRGQNRCPRARLRLRLRLEYDGVGIRR